jgi:hypothetical protein
LRVPAEVSRHFDLVITSAQWQSDEIEARHPGMRTAILPRGMRALCVFGYGKDADALRHRARDQNLSIEFVDPAGCSH